MKISELIAELEKAMSEHGDVQVTVCGPPYHIGRAIPYVRVVEPQTCGDGCCRGLEVWL